jgi:hypothetical protein
MFKLWPALVFLAFLPFISLRAQEQILNSGYENGSNLNVLYRSDKTAQLYATTRGFGFMFRQGKHVTAKTRSYYEIDIQTLKHPKEVKSAGEAESRRRFVYGKVNNVLLLRASLGLQNVIYQKADNKAVEIRYSYSVGPLLAFAKPYYVQVYRTTGARNSTTINFEDENWTPDSGKVIGRGAFAEGLNQLKLLPGASGKFNLSFEYAPYTNLIRAIETGVTLDYFPKAVRIMARNPAENFVITLHVGFVFGRKWF